MKIFLKPYCKIYITYIIKQHKGLETKNSPVFSLDVLHPTTLKCLFTLSKGSFAQLYIFEKQNDKTSISKMCKAENISKASVITDIINFNAFIT